MSLNSKKILTSSLLFVLPVLLLLMFSCVTQKNLEYVQDQDKALKEFKAMDLSDYKLKPNDDLFIQISSLDDAGANVFSTSNRQGGTNIMDQFGASLLSHTIDKEGYLDLPVIGKILVKDKTITQVRMILKDALSSILNQPIISIKLVNRFVTVLGEVKLPGHFTFTNDKITIYDAIGMAGDVTEYGNRKNIVLIRYENNKNIRINLDLTKSDILMSDYYFLRPNDIVYVKPLGRKFWGMREFPFSIILSAVTTAILVLNYVKTN